MFKQSVGLPPQVGLARLRMGKVCELHDLVDLPVMEIAHEDGYPSSQILVRTLIKHRHMNSSDHHRTVRDPVRQTSLQAPEAVQ